MATAKPKKESPPIEDDSDGEDTEPSGRFVQLDARVVERFLENVGSALGGLFSVTTLPAKAKAADGAQDPSEADDDDDDPEPQPQPERKPRGKRNIFLD